MEYEIPGRMMDVGVDWDDGFFFLSFFLLVGRERRPTPERRNPPERRGPPIITRPQNY